MKLFNIAINNINSLTIMDKCFFLNKEHWKNIYFQQKHKGEYYFLTRNIDKSYGTKIEIDLYFICDECIKKGLTEKNTWGSSINDMREKISKKNTEKLLRKTFFEDLCRTRKYMNELYNSYQINILDTFNILAAETNIKDIIE
jgi:hypothetical protein